MAYLSAISNQDSIFFCLNKAIYAGGVRDKSSGMSWMSWINTWLHKTINRVPSKSMIHGALLFRDPRESNRPRPVKWFPNCCTVRKWEFTISRIVSGSSAGICRSAGDFTQRADSWETEEHVWAHNKGSAVSHTQPHWYQKISFFSFHA